MKFLLCTTTVFVPLITLILPPMPSIIFLISSVLSSLFLFQHSFMSRHVAYCLDDVVLKRAYLHPITLIVPIKHLIILFNDLLRDLLFLIQLETVLAVYFVTVFTRGSLGFLLLFDHLFLLLDDGLHLLLFLLNHAHKSLEVPLHQVLLLVYDWFRGWRLSLLLWGLALP